MPNRDTLRNLLATGGIRVLPSPSFDSLPAPLPEPFDFDRIDGMMLGLAVGDALGTEGAFSPPERRRRNFTIQNYPTPDGRGYPSDDSQLAFWALEQMIMDGGFVPEHVADRFTRDRIHGVGMSVSEFLLNRRAGHPWQSCGPRSAGNGAIMRIAPILIPHLRPPSADLWADAALCAMITHNDSAAISSAVAFVAMLWELLRRDIPPEPEWWLNSMVKLMRELECDESYRTKCPRIAPYQGPLWGLLERELRAAHRDNVPTPDACDRWFSTAYLFETLPCVVYILMRHGNDPEEAILHAVNDTWDNDTVGSIVGAAVGALHGARNLPSRWITNLSGRTTDCDDGRMFELLRIARELWGPSTGSG